MTFTLHVRTPQPPFLSVLKTCVGNIYMYIHIYPIHIKYIYVLQMYVQIYTLQPSTPTYMLFIE